ncbi:hypothetical protein ACHAW6_014700 [Cyclotella cf. meneghiniana]
MQPKGDRQMTTETLLLLLNKLPPMAKEAHQAPGISHKLISAATLADVGCELFFHKTGCEISLQGKSSCKDEETQRPDSDGGNNIITTDHTVAQLALAQHKPHSTAYTNVKSPANSSISTMLPWVILLFLHGSKQLTEVTSTGGGG